MIEKPDEQKGKYMITLKQIVKCVVGLREKVGRAPTDILRSNRLVTGNIFQRLGL